MLDDTLLVDPELRQRQRQRRRFLKIGGLLALVLILVFVAARPTRRAIKGWQARRHAEKALRLIDEEKWKEAGTEAHAAYQLRANEPAAIRAVARLFSRTRQPEALGFWKALREKQPLTRQDLRDEAGAALTNGEISSAAAAVKELLGKSEGGPGPADYLLAAQVAAQGSQREQAATDLEKVLADPKSSERQQLQASLLRISLVTPSLSAAKEVQAAGWMRLTKIARGRSEVALDALSILAQHALSAPNEIVSGPAIMPGEELIHALETHPLSRPPQKLLALDLQMHADPAQRDALIDRTIATWRSADNETLVTLAKWLNGKGEYQRELDIIPLERALQTRDLFLQRLDALGALGQWAEIKRLLQDESFPLDPVNERMYLARCNQQLGEITAAENNWQRALEAAADDMQKLLTLADYAEKTGATQIAETAYNTITRDSPHVRVAQQGRLHLAQQTRDTGKIHSILVAMLKHWPNDNAVQNDEAYTRLLLLPGGTPSVSSESADPTPANPGLPAAKSEIRDPASENGSRKSKIDEIERLANDLVRREPTSLPHRTLLALAHLKQGRPGEALQGYIGLQIPKNALTPAALAIHAAVLAANGNEEDARTEAGQIKPEQLLPEEGALIQNLR